MEGACVVQELILFFCEIYNSCLMHPRTFTSIVGIVDKLVNDIV